MNLSDFGLVPHICKTVSPGDVFGRLSVVAIGKVPGTYRYKAVCRCACGNDAFITRLDALIRGATVSCGCYHAEVTRTHGLSRHPLFSVWRLMMERCFNPKHKPYKNYGGRGITVCKRWQSVTNFVSDMYPTYQPGKEIDRIDNDGNYEPKNCRWVTRKTNCNNRRSTQLIEIGGKTQSISQWAEEYQINAGTVYSRLKRGLPIKKALAESIATPSESGKRACKSRWSGHIKKQKRASSRKPRIITFNGKTQHLFDWARELGISDKVLAHRIYERGWSLDRALTTPTLTKHEAAKRANAASIKKRWGQNN